MADNTIIPENTKFGSIPPEEFAKFSGLELLQQMLSGDGPAPSIAKGMNFILVEVEKGRAVFKGSPTLDHYNPAGTVHGGWPATILDSAMGCAVQSMCPLGTMFTTVEFKVNLVRPLFADSGDIMCEGKIVHFGRTIATSEATLKRPDGKLVAHASCTCAVFPVSSMAR